MATRTCSYRNHKVTCDNQAEEHSNYCLIHAAILQGCQYKIREGTDKKVGEYCHRQVARPGAVQCPKHEIMVAGKAQEDAKRMEKLRARKAFKAEQREALKPSPLAAYNPKFDEQKRSGYEA